eukprot:7382354-Prymnesium_polylepis.2
MAWLQVQARSHRLPDFVRKGLRVVSPRLGVEIDKHMITHAHITPRLKVGNLEQPRPDRIQLLGELSRSRVVRAALHANGKVPLRQLEARRALQEDLALLRLRQQPLAHEHHRA